MFEHLPKSITVSTASSASHLQGIAIDEKREFLYLSFTTCLLKTDLAGNIIASVNGIVGHLGCIAFNPADGKVYGSLEFKNDAVGQGILHNLGYTDEVRDGFYIAAFDVDRMVRPDMDAEKDGVMQAVFLNEVYDDYAAEGHRFGCSGIDGLTFAPAFGKGGAASYLYVAYGVYSDLSREDNDHQVILQYDIADWDTFAAPLNQRRMHRCGPEKPNAKYFVYTGNTEYGVQNLEYDPQTETIFAAVYQGHKPQFPNYPMFFLDCRRAPQTELLRGIGCEGETLALTDLGGNTGLVGSRFPLGSTGMISLGGGYYYFAEQFDDEPVHGGVITLHRLDRENNTFVEVSI